MREFLEVFRNRALDVMSSALPAQPLLEDFAIALQVRLPGAVVGINVLDKAGRTFRQSIFPNLPSDFLKLWWVTSSPASAAHVD